MVTRYRHNKTDNVPSLPYARRTKSSRWEWPRYSQSRSAKWVDQFRSLEEGSGKHTRGGKRDGPDPQLGADELCKAPAEAVPRQDDLPDRPRRQSVLLVSHGVGDCLGGMP